MTTQSQSAWRERANEKKNKLNDKAKAKQLQCTHTHTDRHACTESHTQAQAHSLTHTYTANCMLSLSALCARSSACLLPLRCPLLCLCLCLSLSLCCCCRCSLCLRLHFIQFLRGCCCCCCCTSDAAFVAVDANNRSTQTGACRGVKRERAAQREGERESADKTICLFGLYRTLRCARCDATRTRTRRCFVCANNWSRRKLHGGDCSDSDADDDGGGIDSAESGE